MRAAIMQPYFFPYIGYWQLIRSVDVFVVYDDIKYTKKGWINRNRFLLNGKDALFTLPLKKDSDFLQVCQRTLADDFDRQKLLNQLQEAYRKAPHFQTTLPLLQQCILCPENNLFAYILHSLRSVARHLGLTTPLIVSSSLEIDPELKSTDKVQAICHRLGAGAYLNPIGGTGLYSREEFQKAGIQLGFLQAENWEYPQFGQPFVPFLSIVDVLMFNPMERVDEYLRKGFTLS